MIEVRKAADRGHFDHGWLKTFHSFSFADYFDRKHMHFRALRVINEDVVAAGKGFGTHPHRDMEIITYVMNGRLAHKDSMGHVEEITPGDVQTMSAGSGVEHSEFNSSSGEDVHLLQIWILPANKGGKPKYDQKHFTDQVKSNRLCLIASGDGREESLTIGQDVKVYASMLDTGKSIDFKIEEGRGVWVQVCKGEIEVNGFGLVSGDGAAVEQESKLLISSKSDAEFLLFDLK